MVRFLGLALFALVFYSSPAIAACNYLTYGACAAEGQIEYDAGNKSYKFCNGTDWVAAKSAMTDATCASTAQMGYDSGTSNYRFCNGTHWKPVAASATLTACATANQIEYDYTLHTLKWCNGANWIDMAAAAAPAIGELCASGVVYAGVSPDGGGPMYVPPCDYGMTWNGSSCTGTRGTRAWNNGNSSGYVNTTSLTNNNTDGDGNTAVLSTGGAFQDSDSGTGGTQPHQAAQYCTDLVYGGYSDWYLPAKDELNVLYVSKATIGNFTNETSFPQSYYWSSTGGYWDGTYMFGERQNFNGGAQGGNGADYGMRVRCVRKDAPGGGPSPGDVGGDGTLFAGVSPDGNKAMFTTRCDRGQTWNGSACTGSRTLTPWNNGNSSGWVNTQAQTTSTVTGAANTAAVSSGGAIPDSDSGTGGTQPHQAPQYCSDLTEGGHTDWYLPAAEELYLLYANRVALGNTFEMSGSFGSGTYWSSTSNYDDGSGSFARNYNFGGDYWSNGTAGNGKSTGMNIRCVRKE